jgi:hypothetical protein
MEPPLLFPAPVVHLYHIIIYRVLVPLGDLIRFMLSPQLQVILHQLHYLPQIRILGLVLRLRVTQTSESHEDLVHGLIEQVNGLLLIFDHVEVENGNVQN